jgi:Calx-beta domain
MLRCASSVKLVFVLVACLLTVGVRPAAAAATINWSAIGDRAVVLADGTNGVPQGDLMRLGYFDISDDQITANAADVALLDSHFLQFASGLIGDGTGVEGTFTEVSFNNGANFPGQPIYIWVFNSPNLGTATEHGILAAPSNSAWVFPADPVLGVTSVDIGDSGVTTVVGSIGGPVTIGGYPFGSSAKLATIVSVNDVLQYAVLKGQSFTQKDTGSAVASTNSPFEFFTFVDAVSSGSVTAATVQDPSTATHSLSNSLSNLRFQFSDSFTNKTLLDAAYTNATYQFTITTPDGSQTPSVTLPADDYPNAPHVTNWSAAQAIDSSLPFSVTWDAFVGGTSNDFIQLSINNASGSNVFATSSEFLDPLRLNGTNTSVVIPASNITTGQTYHAELMFVKVTSLDTNAVAGAAGVGGFFTATDFDIVTLTNSPSVGSLQFSAMAYSVNESAGMATVAVVRVGGTNGTVTVNYATSNGTAISPTDYIAASGTLTFATGQTSAVFTVSIVNDNVFTGDKTVNLSLNAPTGGASLGAIANAVLTIIDDDSSPGAMRIDFLQSELDDVLECIANVSLTLLESDRAGASADIPNCVSAAQQLLADAQAQATIDALGAKGATKLQKKFASLLKKLLATQSTLDDLSKTDAKALRSLMKVSSTGGKTQKVFVKFKTEAPFVVLEELKGKGGFHGTNERVCYRIRVFDLANGANCGPGVIGVTNLPASVGLDVVLDGIIIKSATDFCVITGEDQGVAQVTATACGSSSSLFLINVGPPP